MGENQQKNMFTNEDLKRLQSLDLDNKIQLSLTRITEFYNRFNGNVYVAFSGGKDSTVLLDLVRRIFPDTLAVFCDTGLEYPEIREFVKTKNNVKFLYPVLFNQSTKEYDKISFREVLERYGYPIISKEVAGIIEDARHVNMFKTYSYRIKRLNGELLDKNGNYSSFNCPQWKYLVDAPFKISNKCCDRMKKIPSKVFQRESNLHPILGTMASESRLRKQQWLRNGCNIFNSKEPKSNPLSFWTEQDILKYITRFKIPIASVYGEVLQDKNGKYYTSGISRSGCIYCMFGCHLEKEPNRFQRLKETHPQLYEYCLKPWDEGGLGMKEVLDFINVKYE